MHDCPNSILVSQKLLILNSGVQIAHLLCCPYCDEHRTVDQWFSRAAELHELLQFICIHYTTGPLLYVPGSGMSSWYNYNHIIYSCYMFLDLGTFEFISPVFCNFDFKLIDIHYWTLLLMYFITRYFLKSNRFLV